MAKSRSFTIFLLKDGISPETALCEDHHLTQVTDADGLPTDCILYIKTSPVNEPWWKVFFGIPNQLHMAHCGALAIVKASDRYFAITFGHTQHCLDDSSIVYDFGLRITLNMVDSKQLKSTDTLQPAGAKRQRTQVPIGKDLSQFYVDFNSEILNTLTGNTKEEYASFCKTVTGSSSLRISSFSQATELPDLCSRCLDIYKREDYKNSFECIRNIEPVRDPTILSQLDEDLLQALQRKDENLHLAIPEIIDHKETIYFTFSGSGKSKKYDDCEILSFYDYLTANNQDMAALSVKDISKFCLRIIDENATTIRRYKFRKAIIFDTASNDGKDAYHLTDGHWYRIEPNYLKQLTENINRRCAEIPFPDFNPIIHEDEGAYNKSVCSGSDKLLCFDTKDISPTGQTSIEPCDIFSTASGSAIFYHVKISTRSSTLSHLFNQGINSKRILALHEESRLKLNNLISSTTDEKNRSEFPYPFTEETKCRVIYAIVTDKDISKKAACLPLFSRISLQQNIENLKAMGTECSFGFISRVKPDELGVKLPRRKGQRDKQKNAPSPRPTSPHSPSASPLSSA